MEMGAQYDLVIVGGGINGAGIARDASGRGLSVLLCEQDDLASYTSSASTKLIHGGLRYLEHYDFALVRKALREREVLLSLAPHIIWPLTFVMPHDGRLRPAWMIRLGLFLYDHLGGRKRLPSSRRINLRRHPAGTPLRNALKVGFTYADCWVQDSRLVVLNALDAAERGARVLTRTRCMSAHRDNGRWRVRLQRTEENRGEEEVTARCLVNAAGPWVSRVLDLTDQGNGRKNIRLVKGSHIVVRRLFSHDDAYILQNDDQRVIFAIPYEEDFTLIGTTDVAYQGNPADAAASPEEVRYLCEAVNRYFATPVEPAQVVWTYSGVRALYEEDETASPSEASRDYRLELDTAGAPLLSVFGGKITTYRTLAQEAMQALQPAMGFSAGDWTATASLPGGNLPEADFQRFLADLKRARPWIPDALLTRYARNYGTRIDRLLGASEALADLGEDFGAGLYEAELRYLARHEWARTADDVLWRRTRLGLRLGEEAANRVGRWFDKTAAARSRSGERPAASGQGTGGGSLCL